MCHGSLQLGSKFVEDCLTLPSVKHWICCAESVVTRLNPRVFRRRAINQNLKGKFIESAVFGSLLYGLQYCAFSKRDQRCLDGYYLRLVKRVCMLPFDYHLSYEEAQKRVGVDHRYIFQENVYAGPDTYYVQKKEFCLKY